ncbi:hypothetical protein ACP3UV_21945 [Mixta calida]
MNKSREQFEAWWEKEWCGEAPMDGWASLRESDGYVDEDINAQWEAWRASRAAIELDVDWPEANDDYWKEGEEGAYARGHEDGKDKVSLVVRKALSAAGLKVKGEPDGDTEGRPTPP